MGDIVKFTESTVGELDRNLKDVRIPRANLGPCPVCGHDIVENRKGYSCWSREDPGCGFVIWKSKAGKTLPVAVARELIKTGRTEKAVTGFKGRSGKSFRARLALQQTEDGKWRVEFDEPWAKEGAKPPEAEEPEAPQRPSRPPSSSSPKRPDRPRRADLERGRGHQTAQNLLNRANAASNIRPEGLEKLNRTDDDIRASDCRGALQARAGDAKAWVSVTRDCSWDRPRHGPENEGRNLMFRWLSKKRLAAVALVAVLAVSGIAVAYFTGGSGSVTGSGTVGSSSAWAITAGTPTWSGTLTALYPGATSDTELIPFTVKNNGSGHQSVTAITATLLKDASGNAETASGTPITGCLASWFTAITDPGNPALPDLAPLARTAARST